MDVLADSVEVYYKNLSYKLKPAPTTLSELLQATSTQIPNYPSDPIFSYKDHAGDRIQIPSTRSLHVFYSDLQSDPSLSIELSQSTEEILLKSNPSLKNSEEDIINLTLLGIVFVDKDLLSSVKFIQTDFSKKAIQEILNLIKQTSIEHVAERFSVPWELIFFLTQQPNMYKRTPYKTINYTKVKNIVRPSQIFDTVQDFVSGKVKKKEILKRFEITPSIFELWLDVYKDPVQKQAEVSHLQSKEKMKLVSCYLTGKISLDELLEEYNVSEEQIVAWAVLFSKEEKVYERERIISAEEKYDVLDRYFKGEYTVEQFQNDYGIGENLFYRWVRQVQSGKPLTSSNIFRTASDELEQAYDIFLQLTKT